jgi:hypothetical protein
MQADSALSVQFIFGYGVGGEYPLASSSAAERAEANKALRFRRGEMVVCTFTMQVRPLNPNFSSCSTSIAQSACCCILLLTSFAPALNDWR